MDTPRDDGEMVSETAVESALETVSGEDSDAEESVVIGDEIEEDGVAVSVERTDSAYLLLTVYLPAERVESRLKYTSTPADAPLPLTSVSPAWADFAYDLIDMVEDVFDVTVSDGLYAHEQARRDGTPVYPFQTVVDPSRDTGVRVEDGGRETDVFHFHR